MALLDVYATGATEASLSRDDAPGRSAMTTLEAHRWLTRVEGGMEPDGAPRRDV